MAGGSVYLGQEKLEEAVTDFRKAIDINPKYIDAHRKLAETFTKIGAPDDEFQKRYKAIENDPENPLNYVDLGVFLHKLQKEIDAIAQYKRALELDPKNPYIMFNLGVGFLDMGLYADAETTFRKAAEINPSYDNGHYNLAISLHKQGKD